MKTFLAIIGGVVVFGLLGLLALAFAPGLINTMFELGLAGKWQVQNGDLKGTTMLFTSSGATTWVMPADIFGLTDCTVSGSYKIVRFAGSNKHQAGTYVIGKLSDKEGSCGSAFEGLPKDYSDKIDFVDVNHVLIDGSSLVRSN
jgi:hypothetical protein